MDFDKPSRAVSFRKPTSMWKKLSTLSLVFAFTSTFVYGSLSALKHNLIPRHTQEKVVTTIKGMPKTTAEVLNIDDHRTIKLMQEVNMEIAEKLQQQIMDLNAEDEETLIVLLIESPGGDIMAGRKILDAIKLSKAPIHAQIIGICASMAAIIAAHCEKVYMTQGSWLLFHNASVGMDSTDVRMVKEWVEFITRIMEEINKSTAERLNLTYDEYIKKINMVWLLTADEAIRQGIADGYVTDIICEKGADGCKEKLYKPQEPRFFPF